MSRRNLLCSVTSPPPTTGLQFPVYLVEGDNGQLGIDVYNYLIEKYCPEALGSNSNISLWKDIDEIIYVTSGKYGSMPIQITRLNVWHKSNICYFRTTSLDIYNDINVYSTGKVEIMSSGGAD